MRKALAVISVVAVFAVLGVAVAAWTTTFAPGSKGYAKAKKKTPLTTMDISATVAATLEPGATAPLSIDAVNNGSAAVTIQTINIDDTIGRVVSGDPTCEPYVSRTQPSFTGIGVVVPPNGGNAQFDIPGALQMDPSTPSLCQDAVFSFAISGTAA